MNEQMIPLLVGKLKKYHEQLFPGDAWKTNMCGIVNEHHFNRLVQLYNDATTKGAVLELGGQQDAESRAFSLTVLSHVSTDMRVLQEEIFGPILPIIGVKHLEEAIEYINQGENHWHCTLLAEIRRQFIDWREKPARVH